MVDDNLSNHSTQGVDSSQEVETPTTIESSTQQHAQQNIASSSANGTPVIKVRGLDNAFGDYYVHKGLDLDVYSGDILGIVGGSGTGKSVLLRSIVGLRPPTAGSVEILGKSIDALSDKERAVLGRNLGVLFQAGALYSSLTVQENIAFPLIEQLGLARKDAEHIAMLKILLVGLPTNAALKYPAELSGGMVKRASLARALAWTLKSYF